MKRRLPRPPLQAAPDSIEHDYARQLLRYVKTMRVLIDQHLTPELPAIIAEALQEHGVRTDAFGSRLVELLKRLRATVDRKYTPEELEALARATGESTEAYNRKAMGRQFKRVLGVDPFAGDVALKQKAVLFTQENVGLITSIRDKFLGDVQSQVIQAVQTGTTSANLASDILSTYGSELDRVTGNAEARARLIARDQISKFNGALTQARQQDLGVSKYRWITAGDERVRPTHRAHSGKVFSWDKPPADTGHPGQDFQCRCVSEPLFSADDVDGDSELARLLNA